MILWSRFDIIMAKAKEFTIPVAVSYVLDGWYHTHFPYLPLLQRNYIVQFLSHWPYGKVYLT